MTFRMGATWTFCIATAAENKSEEEIVDTLCGSQFHKSFENAGDSAVHAEKSNKPLCFLHNARLCNCKDADSFEQEDALAQCGLLGLVDLLYKVMWVQDDVNSTQDILLSVYMKAMEKLCGAQWFDPLLVVIRPAMQRSPFLCKECFQRRLRY